MLVVTRFRVPEPESEAFAVAAHEALAVLASQTGFRHGDVGRNVDDPELWVLATRWEHVGAYRRALSAYEVKLRAWRLLGGALDEPTAYEVVPAGGEPNRARARGADDPLEGAAGG